MRKPHTACAASPAKINLTLRVGAVRPDRYHEIESLVARIELCDEVEVQSRDDGRFSCECDDPAIPCDDSNLVVQAGRRLAQASGTARGAHIRIRKRIPAGAGLGGGSSNAAATLRMLNQVWALGATDATLAEIGAGIGSDVPLFFHGPLCVLRGRGERVEGVAARPDLHVAVLLPPIACPTREVYAAFDSLPPPPRPPSVEDVLADLRCEPADASHLMAKLFNELEPAAFVVRPALADVQRAAIRLARGPVRMSGSGAALYRLFADRREAEDFARRAAEALGVRTVVSRVQA